MLPRFDRRFAAAECLKGRKPTEPSLPLEYPKAAESAERLVSALGLNNRGFTLTDRSLAFTDAASEAEGKNCTANRDQECSHRAPQLK